MAFDRSHTRLGFSTHIIFGLTCHPFSIYVFWMCYAYAMPVCMCMCVCLGEYVYSVRKRMPRIFFSHSTSSRSKFVVLCDLLRLNKLLHPRSNPFDSIRFDSTEFIESKPISLAGIFLSRFRLVLCFFSFCSWKYAIGLWPRIIYASFFFSKYFIYKAKLNGQKVSNVCC